jgi:hypothetical protein
MFVIINTLKVLQAELVDSFMVNPHIKFHIFSLIFH